MAWAGQIVIALGGALALAYARAPGLVWLTALAAWLWAATHLGHGLQAWLVWIGVAALLLSAPLLIPPLHRALEAALPAAIAAEHVENRIRQAVRDGRIRAQAHAEQVCDALATGVISAEDETALARFAALRDRVVQVDHFPQDFGVTMRMEAAIAEQDGAA